MDKNKLMTKFLNSYSWNYLKKSINYRELCYDLIKLHMNSIPILFIDENLNSINDDYSIFDKLSEYDLNTIKNLNSYELTQLSPEYYVIKDVFYIIYEDKRNDSITNVNRSYRLYSSYKSTFTPKYISNNLMYLTNPTNFDHLPPGPSNIFIIRHGEKNSNNPFTNEYYYKLNDNGIDRAVKFPDFINNLGKNGTPITSIVTCLPNMNSTLDNNDNSIRPQNLIMLSAYLLGIPLYMFSKSNVSQPYDGKTILELFIDPFFRGKNVLIVWEHQNIQALVNQIVQCYTYLSNGHTINDLNKNSKYIFDNQNTHEWWINNSLSCKDNEYISKYTPEYQIPYQKYSHLLPYWNTHNFDHIFKFTQKNNKLEFVQFKQYIKTHYESCQLSINMLQYEKQPEYISEHNCVAPIN